MRASQTRSDNHETGFSFTFKGASWYRGAVISLILESRPVTAFATWNKMVFQGFRATVHVPRDRREVCGRAEQKSLGPEWSRIDGRSCRCGVLGQH